VATEGVLTQADNAFSDADYAGAARLYEAARAERADELFQAFIDLNVAQCRRNQGLPGEAVALARRGLVRLPETLRVATRAELLLTLGNSLGDQGQHEEAIACFNDARSLFVALGADSGAMQCLASRSRSLIKIGDEAQARADLERLVEGASQQPRLLSQALNNLAILEWNAGNRGRADQLFRRDLDVVGSLNDSWGSAATLVNLATLEGELGHFEEGIVLARSAQAHAARVNAADLESQATRLINDLRAAKDSN
jgi:tetratricopeptide (TPR) repeat protein